MDEAKVNVYGEKLAKDDSVWETGKELADRVADGNEYKLIPGHTYTKDPTIHVGATSEECWLFVKLNNGIKGIIEADTVEGQMTAKWTCIDTVNGIWAYNTKAEAGENVVIFTSFKVLGTADVSSCAGKTIEITAYAVQADGFGSAEAAWAASGFGTTNSNP